MTIFSSVDPDSILKNDAQAISVKSNRVPFVKCAKTAQTQVKWIEQPYVCESFNYVSTSSDSFNIIVQGNIGVNLKWIEKSFNLEQFIEYSLYFRNRSTNNST